MITWSDIICIILEMFDTSQQELANLLGVSESTMSKIKNGKQKAPFNSDSLFTDVFDPDNPKSLAKDTSAFHLDTLKEIIISKPQYDEVKRVMEDCWNETDYRAFVKKLLQRSKSPAQQNSPADSITTHSPVGAVEIIKQENRAETESSTSVIHRDISPKKERSIQAIFLPNSGDCCYRCVQWVGNRKIFGAYKMPTYGFCVKYNRDKQLSSTTACRDYERREKQIGEW